MKDYLTVVEFAAAAGITKQAVYKRIKQDLAPYVKEQDGKKTISKEALKLFAKEEPAEAAQGPTEAPSLLLGRIEEQADTIKAQQQEIEYLRSMLKSADERNNTLTAHLIESQNKQLELQKNYQLLLGAQNPVLTARAQDSKPVDTQFTDEQPDAENKTTVEQPKEEKYDKPSFFKKWFNRR
jgi:septal ring factor EnvC (AmiA/AmiB activator)